MDIEINNGKLTLNGAEVDLNIESADERRKLVTNAYLQEHFSITLDELAEIIEEFCPERLV